MPNKTKQNTKNSTEQICSQPLYKSQTTHHTHPHQQQPLLAGCAGNHHHKGSGRSHGVEREPDSMLAMFKCPTLKRTHTHHPGGQCQNVGTRNTHKPNTNTLILVSLIPPHAHTTTCGTCLHLKTKTCHHQVLTRHPTRRQNK